MGLYSRSFSPEKARRVYQHRDGASQRRRGCILALDARSTVRATTCFNKTPADAPLARTRRLNHPRHVVGFTRPSARGGRAGDHATSRPGHGRARNERQTGALRRRADAAARLESRSRGARLAETPSRERPPLGGGGAGRVTRSLPHRVSLPALGRSTTRSTVFVK